MDKIYLVIHEIVIDGATKTEIFAHASYDGARRDYDSISNDVIRQWYNEYDESDFTTDSDKDYLCLYLNNFYDSNRDTVMIQEIELQD